jgi:hypothetical protein
VFRRSQIANANLTRFQDLASRGSLDDDPVPASQIMFRYSFPASEEPRALNDVDEFDAGGAPTLIVVFYHPDSPSVNSRNDSSHVFLHLNVLTIEPRFCPCDAVHEFWKAKPTELNTPLIPCSS